MLGMLNAVWKFIMEFCNDPPVIKPPLPKVVRLELVRFMCAVPAGSDEPTGAYPGRRHGK